MTISSRNLLHLALLALVAPACGGSGGGGAAGPANSEKEPNNSIARATTLPLGVAMTGALLKATDVDFWTFTATAGDLLAVDLFARRYDQAGWRANASVPVMSLIDTDKTTVLLRHDVQAFGVRMDLDFPLIRIPATGSYYLRLQSTSVANVATAGGKYLLRLRTRTVAAPVVDELEVPLTPTNNFWSDAETIPANCTLFGVYASVEPDFYKFTVSTPGTVIHVESMVSRLGARAAPISYLDTKLTLFDTDGLTVLQDNDDDQLLDPGIHYLVLNAGVYYLRVQLVLFMEASSYVLSLTTTVPTSGGETEVNDSAIAADPIAYGDFITAALTASDTDFYTFTAQAGDTVWVRCYDSANRQGSAAAITVDFIEADGTTVHPSSGGGTLQQSRRTVFPATGTYFLRVTSSTPTNYALELLRIRTAQAETEPNNTNLLASAFDLNGRAAGVIATPGDEDRFQFTAAAGELVTIVLFGKSDLGVGGDVQATGSTLDAQVDVLDGAGTVLSSTLPILLSADMALSPGDLEPTRENAFIAPAAGTYYVRITDVLGAGSAGRWYVLERR